MHREWIDQIAATEHDVRLDADYALLAGAGIQTLREAVRWPLVDRRGQLDLSSLKPLVAALLRHGLEPIWDLFHYGYPDDLDPFKPRFAQRFSRYCGAVARYLNGELPGPHYFTPVNEASYFAWAAGEVGRFAPHASGRGYELKVCLARAALQAIDAIRAACPGARVVNVDPLCHVVSPDGASLQELEDARHFNHEVVFQFLDMLSGRVLPELGGSRSCLDIVGVNYYWSNQWELGTTDRPLATDDPRRLPLASLLRRVKQRYAGPLMLSETSALADARASWIDELSHTVLELLGQGEGLCGVCLYPVIGMPEWHERGTWVPMGLWDVTPGARLERIPHEPGLLALQRAQAALSSVSTHGIRCPSSAAGQTGEGLLGPRVKSA